jgi:putative ABC transport system substrate-binding protein
MRRREFIAGLCGMAALPVAAHAQQPMPLIGLLSATSAAAPSGRVDGILLALKQAGMEVGQAVRMEYRYADNQHDRLPALAAELLKMSPAMLISVGGPAPMLALKAATTTIPIVFAPLPDPVRSGLVESMNRPGGNITGIAALTIELDPKRLELLNELAPPGPIGVLLNPTRPDIIVQADQIKAAAHTAGRRLVIAYAKNAAEIDAELAMFKERSIAGFLLGADAYFSSQRSQIIVLATRHGWPAIYQWREFVEAGGLASFGPNLFDLYRQVGIYAARILRGEKPADLPVQQPTKFEFVINLRTARALGVTVPLPLLGRADEVIE